MKFSRQMQERENKKGDKGKNQYFEFINNINTSPLPSLNNEKNERKHHNKN